VSGIGFEVKLTMKNQSMHPCDQSTRCYPRNSPHAAGRIVGTAAARGADGRAQDGIGQWLYGLVMGLRHGDLDRIDGRDVPAARLLEYGHLPE